MENARLTEDDNSCLCNDNQPGTIIPGCELFTLNEYLDKFIPGFLEDFAGDWPRWKLVAAFEREARNIARSHGLKEYNTDDKGYRFPEIVWAIVFTLT